MAQSEELDNPLSRAAARADVLRASGLKGLAAATQGRQVALEREQARLSQALGAEHPRVKALAARLEDGGARLRDLKLDIARAETVNPKVAAGEWLLHGYIWTEERSPAADLTVSLVDAQGQWMRALGFAATDARGYFQLRAAVTDRATPREAPAGDSPPLEVFIRITDANRAQLHRSATAVPVSSGRVEYAEVLLQSDTGRGGVAPEDETPPDQTGPTAEPAKKPRRRA